MNSIYDFRNSISEVDPNSDSVDLNWRSIVDGKNLRASILEWLVGILLELLLLVTFDRL